MNLEGFTVVDGGVALVIIMSAILAFSRGLVREVMSILGWVVAAVAAFTFAPQVEPIIREAPVLRDVIGSSCELSILAAFAAVFAVTLVIVSIFTPLFSGMIANSALGPMDQGLGFLFGAARGALLVAVSLIIYDLAVGQARSFPEVENSRSRQIFANFTEQLQKQIPEDAPGWIASQYEQLTTTCAQ